MNNTLSFGYLIAFVILLLYPIVSNSAVENLVNEDCESLNVPFPPVNPYANLTVTATQTAYANRDDEVQFIVTSRLTGPATFTISENSVPNLNNFIAPISSGDIFLLANIPQTITFTPNQPGFLFIDVNLYGIVASTGIAVEPCSIQPSVTPPEDLFTFWEDQIAQLDDVPLNPFVTYRPDKQIIQGQSTFKMVLDNVEGKRVYGWITIPDCPGPFPAILNLPPFGTSPITPEYYQADLGAICLALSIHNYDCEQPVPGNIAYQPQDNFADRQTNYYRTSILGAIQAINYIFTMPQFDGENLAITGQSQGGGLAMIVAGLDNRVQFLAESLGALSDHYGLVADPPKAIGFPYWLQIAEDLSFLTQEDVMNELYYFDAAFLAANFEGPSLHVVSFNDPVCSPATTFAAINQMTGPKTLVAEINAGHSSSLFWGARTAFWENHLPLSSYPSCESPIQLPITLKNFYALAEKNTNQLHWITTSELNTSHFEIERSSDGKSFEKIATINAIGYSNIDQRYSFEDQTPFKKTYYRLKMVDLDGTFEYSPITFLENNFLNDLRIEWTPNPFNETLHINLINPIEATLEIHLFNTLGIIAYQKTIPPHTSRLTLPTNALEKGLYQIVIFENEQIIQQGKLIKR